VTHGQRLERDPVALPLDEHDCVRFGHPRIVAGAAGQASRGRDPRAPRPGPPGVPRRAPRREELRPGGRREEAPGEREVDARVEAAEVDPVDDAGELALRDEQPAEVEVAVTDGAVLRRRQLERAVEQLGPPLAARSTGRRPRRATCAHGERERAGRRGPSGRQEARRRRPPASPARAALGGSERGDARAGASPRRPAPRRARPPEGSARRSSGARRGSSASSRSAPATTDCRRGKRNVRSPSTRKTL